MGKQSRRPRRRDRAKRLRHVIQPSGQLKIIVATSPEGSRGHPSIESDLRLIRSALLYADRVELVSPVAIMLGAAVGAAAGGPIVLVQAMAEMDDDTLRHLGADDPAGLRATFASLVDLETRSRAERRAIHGRGSRAWRQMMDGLQDVYEGEGGFAAVASEMFEKAGGQELAEAHEADVLTLATDAFDLGSDTDTQVAQYIKTLMKLLSDPTAHLLLDDQMSSMARSMVNEGHVQPHELTLQHIGQVSTGAGLTTRLPAFPDTTMKRVLETRLELEEPLVKYRRGVAKLADRLHGDPLDGAALDAEIDNLWRDEVEPALADLRLDLSKSRIARDAALSLGTDLKTVVAAVAGPVLSTGLTNLNTLTAVATGVTPAAIKAGTAALREGASASDRARAHDLYYLLELDRLL